MQGKVIIKHQPSYRPGKYGLTVHRASQSTANVREIKDDDELSKLLLELGYTNPEIFETIEKLRPVNSDVIQPRSVDERALDRLGF